MERNAQHGSIAVGKGTLFVNCPHCGKDKVSQRKFPGSVVVARFLPHVVAFLPGGTKPLMRGGEDKKALTHPYDMVNPIPMPLVPVV